MLLVHVHAASMMPMTSAAVPVSIAGSEWLGPVLTMCPVIMRSCLGSLPCEDIQDGNDALTA